MSHDLVDPTNVKINPSDIPTDVHYFDAFDNNDISYQLNAGLSFFVGKGQSGAAAAE